MTDYTWPDDLAPFAQSFWLQPHVGRSESPFTRQQKIYGLSAPRWITKMAFRGGYDNGGDLRDVGGRMDALLAKLEGGMNRALVYDFRRSDRTGEGAPRYDGHFTDGADFTDGTGFALHPLNFVASSGATSMTWINFEIGDLIFKAGDYIGGDGRAHIVTDDATVGYDGTLEVNFKPPLIAEVAAGDGIYENVTSPFRLTSDDAGANSVQVGDAVVYEIEMVEDL